MLVGRHAQSEANIDPTAPLSGSSFDPALTQLGVEQAHLAGLSHQSDDILYIAHSRTRRARETAEVMAEALGTVIDIVPVNGLQPGILGALSDLSKHDPRVITALQNADSESLHFKIDPTAESPHEVATRMFGTLDFLANYFGDDAHTMAITHNFPIKAMRAVLLGYDRKGMKEDVKVKNAAIFEYTKGKTESLIEIVRPQLSAVSERSRRLELVR